MLNEYLLLNGLKTRLDADTTLKTLLNVKGTSSKVILGPSRPTVAQCPEIQLYVSQHTVDEEAKWDTVEVTANVFASDQPGPRADVEQIANIMNRVVALIDEQPPTLTGHQEYNLGLVGLSPVTPTPVQTDSTTQHFQEARFTNRGMQTT